MNLSNVLETLINVIDNSFETTKINLGIKPTRKLREEFSFTKTKITRVLLKNQQLLLLLKLEPF